MAVRGRGSKYLITRAYGVYFNFLAFFSPDAAAHRALRTFSKVRKGRIQPAQEEFLNTSDSVAEEIAGHRIQSYRWSGPGPKVLLIHGWESNSHRWKNLIGFLKDAGFEVIAFDAPAHGRSSGRHFNVPLYAECVDFFVQKYRPETLIGHSVGGMTALYHAYAYPNDIVQKIVTIGAPSEFREIMSNYQKLLGFNDRVLEAMDRLFHQKFGYHIKEFSAVRFVQNNQKKGLLLHDKQDLLAPYHASERVHEAWQNSILVSTEGLGHSMHQDSVSQRILEFLKTG